MSMKVRLSIRGYAMVMATVVLAGCGSEQTPADAAAKGKASASTPAAATAAAPAAPGAPKSVDWSKHVEKTADGGFRVGNPDAAVKLVEFGSFTCSHCADFHKQAHEILKSQYVAGGKVSYELRNFVMNPADYAASLVARCQQPAAYFALADTFFRTQENWLKPFMDIPKEKVDELNAMSPEKRLLKYIELGGLTNMLKARGIGQAKVEQCLSDKSGEAELEAIRKQAVDVYKLDGTPTFVINGEKQDKVYGWEALKPKLDAALN